MEKLKWLKLTWLSIQISTRKIQKEFFNIRVAYTETQMLKHLIIIEFEVETVNVHFPSVMLIKAREMNHLPFIGKYVGLDHMPLKGLKAKWRSCCIFVYIKRMIFNFLHLFIICQTKWPRQKRSLPYTGSPLRWLQTQGLSRLQLETWNSTIQVSCMCGRGPTTWVILCYFPRDTVTELDWKKSS